MTEASLPWREVLERAPAMLGVVNLTGHLVWVNQTFAGALGTSPQALQGGALADLVHTDDREDVLAALARAPVDGAEHRFADGADGWRTLAWRAAPPEDGLVTLSAVDVTAEHERRGELAAGISHDVRAPLRAIDGFAGLLLGDDGAALPDTTSRYLALMRDASAELREQVDGLVELLRLSDQPLRRTTLDVAGAARAAAGRREEGPAVTAGALPPALADPALVDRILDELLANAAKAGATRVTIGWDAPRKAYTFSDDGIGFDGRRADKATRVFGRLHERERFPGAGIGLALVRRIAERHGGGAWAEGAAGEGATIVVALGP